MSLLVRQLNERLAETQARLAAAERVVEAARVLKRHFVSGLRVPTEEMREALVAAVVVFDASPVAYFAEPPVETPPVPGPTDGRAPYRVTDLSSWPDMAKAYDPDYMCPNCVTPWKCNGPHTAQRSSDLNFSQQRKEGE